jgi:hypothetical protein
LVKSINYETPHSATLQSAITFSAVGRNILLTTFIYKTQQSPAGYLLHAGFLLSIYFDPEDAGNMFLRSSG